MMDGIAEAGRYWFIWKCVEAGLLIALAGGVIGFARWLVKHDKEA